MQRTLKNLTVVAAMGASLFGVTGCMNTNGRSAGRYMDDRDINHKVENALESEQVYKFPTVKVTTYRGITQLSGFVETEDQKRRAGEVAHTVMGPSEVINNISVRQILPTPTGQTTGSSGATGTSTTTTTGSSTTQPKPVTTDETTK